MHDISADGDRVTVRRQQQHRPSVFTADRPGDSKTITARKYTGYTQCANTNHESNDEKLSENLKYDIISY